MAEIIQIQVDVQGDLATIWHYWNEPKHIEHGIVLHPIGIQ